MTHMVRYPAESKSGAEVVTMRERECDADMWAGMAIADFLAEKKIPPDEGRLRLQTPLAIAFEIGHPGWSEAPHPRPEQRALCAATGLRAGLHLRLVREYEKSRRPELLAQIKVLQIDDPRWFGPDADVWAWTRSRTQALIADSDGNGDQGFLAEGAAFTKSLERLTKAAEEGPAALRRDRDELTLKGFLCTVSERGPEVKVRCAQSGFASETIARTTYENTGAQLRLALSQIGWTRESDVPGGEGVRFRRGNASAEVSYQPQRREIAVAFWAQQSTISGDGKEGRYGSKVLQALREMQQGHCSPEFISPITIELCEQQLAIVGEKLRSLGKPISSTYRGIQRWPRTDGSPEVIATEVYRVQFEQGTMTWAVSEGPDGKFAIFFTNG
jgi:hypothetical protein